jgi:hypothetical protein
MHEASEAYRAWNLTKLKSGQDEQQLSKLFVTEHGQLGCGLLSVMLGDEVCVALGSDHPILLRRGNLQNRLKLYSYISPLYIHGLMEGQALSGPLPASWSLTIGRFGRKRGYLFLNRQTNERTKQDPRLDPLPVNWEAIEKEDEMKLVNYVQHHRNRNTGEIINSDPRLLPEALKARGVDVTTVILL